MPVNRPYGAEWTYGLLLAVLFSGGFLGSGVLGAPLLYFLGIVLPIAYLLQADPSRSRDDAGVRPGHGVWLALAGGGSYLLGLEAHGFVGWLIC